MSHHQTITAIDSQNNVTYIQLISPQQNSHIYFETDDEDEPDTKFLIEKVEDEDQEYLEEEQAGETYEILESVVVDPKVAVKKEVLTKQLVEKKQSADQRKLGRKRLYAEQTREIRKSLANTNKAYINARGLEVPPKVFDESFECTCPKRCTEPSKLPLKTRRQIFNMFWNIGTYEGRCAFINSCVNEIPKKRCYTKNKEESRRKNTRKYFLKGVEVCKITFVKTLMISNSRIDVCLMKMETENFTDERGRKRSYQGFSEEKRTKVISHIKESYSEGKTLRSMWQTFMNEHPDDKVSESYYKRLFYENFDLKVKREKPSTTAKKHAMSDNDDSDE